MATIDSVITESRYDLRDLDSTQYTDAELYYYANRGLRQLENALSANNSDWVYNEADLSLVSGNNYVDSPSRCILVRSAWISSVVLTKKSPERIYNERKYVSASGQPRYFAEKGTQLIFERSADSGYTVKAYFDQRTATLTSGDDMPHNDEFNDSIREMIVVLGHKRNEHDVVTDSYIYNFFNQKLDGNVIRRNHVPYVCGIDF